MLTSKQLYIARTKCVECAVDAGECRACILRGTAGKRSQCSYSHRHTLPTPGSKVVRPRHHLLPRSCTSTSQSAPLRSGPCRSLARGLRTPHNQPPPRTAMAAVEPRSNVHNTKRPAIYNRHVALCLSCSVRDLLDDQVVQSEARGHLYSVQRAHHRFPRSKGKFIEKTHFCICSMRSSRATAFDPS
jgi:hypothetical protein